MFASLRSRLWLSYLLIIVAVLLVVTLSMVLFLVRNPRLTRLAEANLTNAANAIQRQRLAVEERADLQSALTDADELLDVRIIIFGQQGILLGDSRADSEAALPDANFFLEHNRGGRDGPPSVAQFTDAAGEEWLFTTRGGQGRFVVVVATPRPSAPALAVLTDELLPPVLRAAALALVISLLFAFLISRSIARPLQGMSAAANQVADGQAAHVEPRGPREVQSLAHSLNDMSTRLQANQQSQRDFVANVSHELKTPLTSIQGFAQAILDGTVKSGAALNQAAQVIYDEAGRMNRLVLELLDLARLDAGIAAMEREIVDVAALLRKVAERFAPQANAAGVKFEIQTTDLPAVSGDYDRLTQLFTNLLENAIKFTPEGGSVLAQAEADQDEVLVSVADSGPGIPAEEASRIFERFYQADKSRRAGERRGVGLGLPIAKQIALAHGGDIRLESNPGQGSRFIVRLPCLAS